MEMKEIIGIYEAPEVEVIEVEVEKGFATSDTTTSGESGSWGTGNI